ncbi:alpha/beta fold hydrolase [Ottowia sp.]|uniref:alpha/beta fold hydrolase n=1 Tax=Ottowia sp. TaxID=1898956 RepID=UPI003A84EC87
MYQPRRAARSEFVPIRLHRYHVHVWGNPAASQPPLVLMHGWMDVGASYQFMVDALSDDFLADRLIIAPDWRGFGRTTGPACDHYSFADYLGDLEYLLDHYAGERPVDLVGHSMGGNAVMLYSGTRAARIRRLINLEGFGMPATRASQAPGRYARWIDEIKTLHSGGYALKTYADADGVADRLMKTNRRLLRNKALWLARQWAESRQDADGQTRWHVLGDAAHRVINPQLYRVDEVLALLAHITAPMLMVEAADDSLSGWWEGKFTLDEFHERLQAVPNVRRLVLPDCGHMLHHDQPERLALELEAFLQS